MKITTLSSLLIILFASSGCLSDSKSVERPQPVQSVEPVATSSNAFSADTSSAILPTTVSAASPASPQSKVAVNPAHGQPGHRCEYPVGATMDGKQPAQPSGSANTAVPVATTASPVPIVTPPVAAPQQVATGMNPAHGQPGHRCDIAVGAPLNSKPTQ